MSYVLTLVGSAGGSPVTEKHFKEIGKVLEHYNVRFTSKPVWLDKDKAADIGVSDKFQFALVSHMREILAEDRIDFFVNAEANRQKKLLLADMDSTIVTSETLDELAEYAGIKDKVAQITARAMNGELDFHAALRERVGLLKGLNVTALTATLEETRLSEGAKVFVNTMRAHGATCVLVSGGFTFFTQKIADICGFQFNHGNILEIEHEKLTGGVTPPILDKFSKVAFLKHYMQEFDFAPENCLAIGDGANDVPMLKLAGLGIGYQPKPAVAQDIANVILYGDLTAALYAQGYTAKHFKQKAPSDNPAPKPKS